MKKKLSIQNTEHVEHLPALFVSIVKNQDDKKRRSPMVMGTTVHSRQNYLAAFCSITYMRGRMLCPTCKEGKLKVRCVCIPFCFFSHILTRGVGLVVTHKNRVLFCVEM